MKTNRLPLLITAISAIVGVAIFITRALQEKHFPDMPPGAYAGTVSGLADQPIPLYLERFQGTSTFLFVAFVDGFKPQAIIAASDVEAKALNPLVVNRGQGKLVLSGTENEADFSGAVDDGTGQTIGEWRVAPVKQDSLHDDRDYSGQVGFDLKRWLEVRAEERELRRMLRLAVERIDDGREKKQKLEKFLGDQTLLRERAGARKAELTAELQRAIDERKDTASVVGDLVGELDLLGRIRKRGQVVTLARRVALRENRWYQVNWGVEEDMSGLDETGNAAGIDMQRLESAVTRANEVRALLREINVESQKIHDLENQLLGPSSESSAPLMPEEEVPVERPRQRGKEREKESLWDRVFG